MVVITDRLGKGVVANSLENINTKLVIRWFLQHYYPHHFLLRAIISDRGTQFTSTF